MKLGAMKIVILFAVFFVAIVATQENTADETTDDEDFLNELRSTENADADDDVTDAEAAALLDAFTKLADEEEEANASNGAPEKRGWGRRRRLRRFWRRHKGTIISVGAKLLAGKKK